MLRFLLSIKEEELGDNVADTIACGPYKTRNGAQRRQCTSKSAENHRKLGNNYRIGFTCQIRVTYRVRASV